MNIRKFFLFKKNFWITVIKVFFLLFVASMVLIQLPELQYDLGAKKPVLIDGVKELNRDTYNEAIFASIGGVPSFERAFVYQRYGLSYTYFIVEPYGMKLVVRTYEKVDDDWKNRTRFVGKLKPFEAQPFSYRIQDIFMEQFQEKVPEGAFFLGLDDVPKLSGWQIGATVFASLLWIVMFLLFFIIKIPLPKL